MSERRLPHRPPDFEEWYEDVSVELTHRISAGVGDLLIGREVAAEAFARAYERWPRVRRMESPSGWVYRTAMNINRRSWRRRAIEKRTLAKLNNGLADLYVEEHDTDILIRGQDPEFLESLVNDLPDRMQTAVRLRYWDGLTEAAVAERMGITVGTASAALSHARRHLEAALQSNHPTSTQPAKKSTTAKNNKREER